MTLFIYVFSISILVLFKEIFLFEFLFLDAQNTLKIKIIIKLDPKIKKESYCTHEVHTMRLIVIYYINMN